MMREIAITTAAACAALAFASPASAVSIEHYIEVAPRQPATSQVCPQVPEVRFTASQGDEFVLVQFTARAGPGPSVERKLGVGGGDHILGVRAEGIEGGCNTGVVNSWGGTVHVESLIDPDDLRQGRSPSSHRR